MGHLKVEVAVIVTSGGVTLAFATLVIGLDSWGESKIRADEDTQNRMGESLGHERMQLVKLGNPFSVNRGRVWP